MIKINTLKYYQIQKRMPLWWGGTIICTNFSLNNFLTRIHPKKRKEKKKKTFLLLTTQSRLISFNINLYKFKLNAHICQRQTCVNLD